MRDDRLGILARGQERALAFAERIAREVSSTSPEALNRLYADLLEYWWSGLLPVFRAEGECLLARLIRVVPPEDQAVVRAQTEHLYLEALVATMRDTQEAETRRDAIRRFGETLARHLRWETDGLLPLALSELSSGDLDMIARDLAAYLPETEQPPRPLR